MKDAAKEKPTRKYTGINAYIGREKQFQMNNKSYTLRIFIKEEQTNTKEQREGIIKHIWQNSTCIFNLNIFFRKLGVEKKKTCLNLKKNICKNLQSHHILQWKLSRHNIKNSIQMFILFTPTQKCMESYSQCNMTRKRNERLFHRGEKRSKKTVLILKWHICLCTKSLNIYKTILRTQSA